MSRRRFNRVLSQLECVHGIAKPVPVSTDPLNVSDFIHAVFENKEEFGLGGTNLTVEWFADFSDNYKDKASSMIQNILQENGHIISRKSIMEGIDKFSEGFENAR